MKNMKKSAATPHNLTRRITVRSACLFVSARHHYDASFELSVLSWGGALLQDRTEGAGQWASAQRQVPRPVLILQGVPDVDLLASVSSPAAVPTQSLAVAHRRAQPVSLSENTIHRSLDARRSRDFAEMDRIIKDQHLSLALQRAPHMRTAHDLDLVTKFVQSSWQRASELGTKSIQVRRGGNQLASLVACAGGCAGLPRAAPGVESSRAEPS